jgi:alpha-mannosidase
MAENRFYRIAFAPGGIRSLYDKEQQRELLQTDRYLGGEVFTALSVAEDNRGKGTDAGEFGAVPQPVLDASFDRVSLHGPEWKRLESGAVRTVYGLELPWKNTVVSEKITLWNDMKRIDCDVRLNDFNGELWREFRLAFPLALDSPN